MGSNINPVTPGMNVERNWNDFRNYGQAPSGFLEKGKAHLETIKDAFTPSWKNDEGKTQKGKLYNEQVKPGYDSAGKELKGFGNKLVRHAGTAGLVGLAATAILGGFALFTNKKAAGQENGSELPPTPGNNEPPPPYGTTDPYASGTGAGTSQTPINTPMIDPMATIPMSMMPMSTGFIPPYIP